MVRKVHAHLRLRQCFSPRPPPDEPWPSSCSDRALRSAVWAVVSRCIDASYRGDGAAWLRRLSELVTGMRLTSYTDFVDGQEQPRKSILVSGRRARMIIRSRKPKALVPRAGWASAELPRPWRVWLAPWRITDRRSPRPSFSSSAGRSCIWTASSSSAPFDLRWPSHVTHRHCCARRPRRRSGSL